MSDTYPNFQALQKAEAEGEDWIRESRDRGSRIAVMAPHGGWIEPFTTELARAVAGEEWSFYSFMGMKRDGNESLHLTSHRFDEPVAVALASRVDRVLAVHGERTGDRAFVMVGGRWDSAREILASALTRAGFQVRTPREGLGGRHPRNICNRGRLGAGCQLEISEGLRRQLRQGGDQMDEFVTAVRGALLTLEASLPKEMNGPGSGGNDWCRESSKGNGREVGGV